MLSITNRKGQNHVTSAQFRDIIQSIVGHGSYIANLYNLMEPELSTNNKIKIKSGLLIHHGYMSEIQPGTYDEINYQNGTQGMLRVDLVVARYRKNEDTQIEDMEWVVIQGTPDESNPVVPDYIVGNMQEGDLTDDCPVFEIHFDGINVTEVKKLLPIIPTAAGIQGDLEAMKNTLTNGYKHLQSSVHGQIELPNGYKAVYGVYPCAAMVADSDIGGYSGVIDISAYGLKEAIWSMASPRFTNGFPRSVVVSVSTQQIKLGCDINNSNGFIQWMVIG